ncbi:hypothetical protein [Acinetobacter junii]
MTLQEHMQQKRIRDDAKESAKRAAAQIHDILKKRYPNAVKK